MKPYELKFLDGPGSGKSIYSDKAPQCIWLCNRLGKRWWALRKPTEKVWIEKTYKQLGHAPRFDGTALVSYGVANE